MILNNIFVNKQYVIRILVIKRCDEIFLLMRKVVQSSFKAVKAKFKKSQTCSLDDA